MRTYNWFENRLGSTVRLTTQLSTKHIPINNYDDVARHAAIALHADHVAYEDGFTIHRSNIECEACSA